MSEPESNDEVLGEMLEAMASAFRAERQEAEPYKELFKAGSTYTGLLRDLEHKMMVHVLDAMEVLRSRHGVKPSHKQFAMLMALPLLVHIAEKDASKHEGWACSVDKAYYIISEQLIAAKHSGDTAGGGDE